MYPNVASLWRPVMRRAIAGIAILLTLAGCASGCDSAGGEQAPQANGIGPITFAVGSDDIAWLNPVINGWNRAHPDQKVTELLLPEASNVQLDQLVANLQAKSPIYDVIDMDVVWTAEFASNGWILALAPKDFGYLKGFFPSAVATAYYQGRLYAVPGLDGGAQVPPQRLRRHAGPVRGDDGELRLGGPVGGRLDPAQGRRGHP